MFTKSNTKSALQDAIDHLFTQMSASSGESAEYAKLVEQLSKLHALKDAESKRRLSPDTVAIVAGNLIGILLIVGHEHTGVVASKALNFVMKAR